jgi:hypothetical protein
MPLCYVSLLRRTVMAYGMQLANYVPNLGVYKVRKKATCGGHVYASVTLCSCLLYNWTYIFKFYLLICGLFIYVFGNL